MSNNKICIFSHTSTSYAKEVVSLFGKGAFHAKKIYSDWYKKGKVPVKARWIEKQAESLVEEILANTDFSLTEISGMKKEGEIVKFLLKFADKMESESVLIPMKFGHTLCISSQIGCRKGCAFCETGKMGILRNLSTKEILLQVFLARFSSETPIRNIVFMGMGEPFDNYVEVMKALEILTEESGMGFARRSVTISTSGVVDKIYRFIEDADPAINLAISLNAPNDEIRAKIMPVNKEWNLQKLKEAMLSYTSHPRREILIEYVLLKGINDSIECAKEVAEYLKGLKVRINLIPYNPQSRDIFSPPDWQAMENFLEYLRKRRFRTLLRKTKGQKIMAACGQLGNKNLRKILYQNKLSVLP